MSQTPLSTDDQATQKMDPELKAKWVEALRGGKYKQGRGGLRDANNCFCCLGVLADVTDPENWSMNADAQVGACDLAFYSRPHGEVEMLSDESLDRLGISIENATRLACMNDGEDGPAQNFEAIAEWIEVNL